jgi:outer membrane receptor protein involved in Fe transport
MYYRVMGAVLVTVLANTPLLAQEQAEGSAFDKKDNINNKRKSRNVLEEVIVTATKREESLREIPASITAFQGENLERSGIHGVGDIVKLVPGVNMTHQEGGTSERVTVRGISAQNATNLTTGVLIGDVSFVDNYIPQVLPDPLPFDMRSVEILKGPQGTLFGAGSLNGAIRYVLEPAEFEVFTIKYFAEYSEVKFGSGAPIYGGVVNIPMGENFALRLLAFERESPGWIDDTQANKEDINSVEQDGMRAILAWRPNERWDIALTYMEQDTFKPDVGVSDSLDGRLSHSNRPRPSPSQADYTLADLKVNYEFENFDFISDTAHVYKHTAAKTEQTANNDGSGQTPLSQTVKPNGESETVSQEFRLVSNTDKDSPWKWVAGISAYKQHLTGSSQIRLGEESMSSAEVSALLAQLNLGSDALLSSDGRALLIALAHDVELEEVALFGEVTRYLGDDFELTLGGRYYQTSSVGTQTESGLIITAATNEVEHVIVGDLQEEGFNPKISLVWHFGENVLSYASISRGFRIGGVQTGVATVLTEKKSPDSIKSDELWSYEIGLRTQWLDNTLQFDVTAFYADWKDPQLFVVDAAAASFFLDNASGVETEGVEAALQYVFPIDGLSFSLSAAYTDAKTSEPYENSDGSIAPPGTDWPAAPKFQTATILSYQQFVGDWDLSTSISHTYISEAINDLEQRAPIFDYAEVGLQFGVENESMKWLPDVSLSVSNLLDERGLANLFLISPVASPGTTVYDAQYIRPRTVTLRLSGKF